MLQDGVNIYISDTSYNIVNFTIIGINVFYLGNPIVNIDILYLDIYFK